jgi:uncharacterized membrane protein YbhN (UPF0104 family)
VSEAGARVRARVARWAGWVVLVAVLVSTARAVDWRPALAAAADARPLWLLAAVAINAALLPLATLQWGILIPPDVRPSGRSLFHVIALGSSISNGTPMIAGQLAGVHLLATRGGLGYARAGSVTVVEQLSEGVAKTALMLAAAAAFPRLQSIAGGSWLVVIVPAATAALFVVARSTAIPHLHALRQPGTFAAAATVGMVKKVVEGLALAAAAAALGVSLPLWAVIAAVAAVNLSQFVALTPGNLGPYEAAAFLVFREAGVAGDAALALAVVQHLAYLLPVAGTGWLLEGARIFRRGGRAAGEAPAA